MQELIKLQYDNDRITVLARDLHGFLEIESNFTDVYKRQVSDSATVDSISHQ